MASRTKRRADVKCAEVGEASEVVRDQLEELARDGARRMLVEALNEEVDEQGNLRKTLFLDKLGEDYVADACRWAHEAVEMLCQLSHARK